MSTPIYNDNATPFGGRAETFFRKNADGSAYELLGIYECETLDIKRPSTIVEKHDHIGRPKGWFSVPGFPTATATVQIPANVDVESDTGATEIGHLQNGDAFVDDFGFDREIWIVTDTSDPFVQKDYRKQQVTLRLTQNPPPIVAALLTA